MLRARDVRREIAMPVRRDKSSGGWIRQEVVRLLDGTKKRITSRGKTRAICNGNFNIARDKNMYPERFASSRKKEVPTFEVFAKQYIDVYAKTNNKPSSVNGNKSILKHHLVPAFGPFPLDRIEPLMIAEYVADKLDDYPKKTINNQLAVLSKMGTIAVEWKKIDSFPRMPWFKIRYEDFEFFDFGEVERLLAGATKDEEWYSAILLAVKTGMRLGELRAVRWDDIDLVKGQVYVRRNLWRTIEGTPKSGKSRIIELAPSAVTALKEHRHLRGERVFLDPAGRDYTLGTWRYALYRGCRRAGLRKIGWHVLRHTFASHLAMRGKTMRTIQLLMGHSTVQMTERYAHLSPVMLGDAVRSLDEPAPCITGASVEEKAK